eukprot:GILJ01002778.1.p1 GENE.GILJ01002778.1~~GILJ01002778.1.p1  ORF type:complete len:335 (-),score=37.13 GILJ01002778.1:411-1415(-)
MAVMRACLLLFVLTLVTVCRAHKLTPTNTSKTANIERKLYPPSDVPRRTSDLITRCFAGNWKHWIKPNKSTLSREGRDFIAAVTSFFSTAIRKKHRSQIPPLGLFTGDEGRLAATSLSNTYWVLTNNSIQAVAEAAEKKRADILRQAGVPEDQIYSVLWNDYSSVCWQLISRCFVLTWGNAVLENITNMKQIHARYFASKWNPQSVFLGHEAVTLQRYANRFGNRFLFNISITDPQDSGTTTGKVLPVFCQNITTVTVIEALMKNHPDACQTWKMEASYSRTFETVYNGGNDCSSFYVSDELLESYSNMPKYIQPVDFNYHVTTMDTTTSVLYI